MAFRALTTKNIQISGLFLVRELKNTDKNFKRSPKNVCNLSGFCRFLIVCFCREFGYLGKLRTVINSDEHQHEQFMDRSIPF